MRLGYETGSRAGIFTVGTAGCSAGRRAGNKAGNKAEALSAELPIRLAVGRAESGPSFLATRHISYVCA